MTDIEMQTPGRAVADGLRAAMSLVPAIVPLGVALGVALGETAAPTVVAWATAPLLIAGASQLVVVTQLDGGASVVAAAFAAVLVNTRFVVYGSALAHRFEGQPRWFRWFGPWFVVDQTYAIVARGAPPTARGFRDFYLGAAMPLWGVWTAAVAIGVALGPVLPSWLPLEFVLSAMFVALVVPGLADRAEVVAALWGASVAGVLEPAPALVVSAAAAALVGVRLGTGDDA